MGVVDPLGVAEGLLDPIVGMVPVNQSGVAFPEICTVAVWRRIDLITLAVGLVVMLPLALLCLYAAIVENPWFLVVGLPIDLILAFVLYRSVGVKMSFVRVTGSSRTITVRFDSPFWRRHRFHDELLRRAGISASMIP
jgi:hypothetical protein